ncbi:MAG: hypothetical protein HQ511_13770 [Rhodospirillales bacterium]|nr:hypothetical protein [Rhodospirillales bacterium]
MIEVVRKTFQSLRYSGLRRTLQQFRRRLIPTRIFDADVFLINRFDFSDLENETPYPFDFRWGFREDRERLTEGGLPLSTVDHYFDLGGRPVVVEDGGNVVGYTWVIPDGGDLYDWLRLEVGPKEVWGATAFVIPAYRGKEIGPMMKGFAYRELAGEGYERSLTMIEKLNTLSKHAAAKVPQRVVGKISYVRLLGLTVAKAADQWFLGYWGSKNRLVIPVTIFENDRPKPGLSNG